MQESSNANTSPSPRIATPFALVDAVDRFAFGKTHLTIDRDSRYYETFRAPLESAGMKSVFCTPRFPQCNVYTERFVQSIKVECLSRLVFPSKRHPSKTISNFLDHYRYRRNHQGIGDKLIKPPLSLPVVRTVRYRKEVGGIIKYCFREAAQWTFPRSRGKHIGSMACHVARSVLRIAGEDRFGMKAR